MKNYFSFKLTAEKFLPVWLLFLVLFVVPYVALIIGMKRIQPGDTPSFWLFLGLFLLMIAALVFTFFIVKLFIEGVAYKEKTLVFSGDFATYLGKILLGMFLTIITLTIYMAWFMRDLNRFFVDKTSHDSQEFKFQGNGGKLFVILLLTLYLPMIILSIILGIYSFKNGVANNSNHIISQIISFIIMIPYTYLFYKWMVDFTHKGYHIKWETDFWESCGKIAVEMILCVITIGIYSPLATLRLYKYFSVRTVAVSDEKKYRFGFDEDQWNDFLFIWGQLLLTIITLGIYYPWAYCKIGARILGKTYLENS
jgi:uncharacterized membrane protein YjgN (DUF898 family)